MMTQQRTCNMCNPELIAIFARVEKIKGQSDCKDAKILSFHWIKETVQIEAVTVRQNFDVNMSEQFTIRESTRPFEELVNMDL